MKCRVKIGAELAHNGTVLKGGAELDLPVPLAFEVKHLVEEVMPGGEGRPIGTAEREAAEFQEQLGSARPHERVSLLEQRRDVLVQQQSALQGELEGLNKAIAYEQQAAVPVVAVASVEPAGTSVATAVTSDPEAAKSAPKPAADAPGASKAEPKGDAKKEK